jgi:hypothetical protein|tara:strand:- start:764 stop:991 length:228 start_codon:yes stop_codon:yes gene_type:complete
MKTEHGTLTVEDVEDIDTEAQSDGLHLTWAGKSLLLFENDEDSLLQIGGKDGSLDKGEKEYLDGLAVRIAGAFSD